MDKFEIKYELDKLYNLRDEIIEDEIKSKGLKLAEMLYENKDNWTQKEFEIAINSVVSDVKYASKDLRR
jgi:hypothetical protein